MDNLLEQILKESIYKCKECGAEEDSSRWANGKELEQKQLCFKCDFWMDLIERANDPDSVRVKGYHYWIGEEKEKGHRGFEGRPFLIKFNDGREVRTTNLWGKGEIPERFRDRLPDNGIFLNV